MSQSDLVPRRLSANDRRRILSYALAPEQMAFFHVAPSESGLPRTVWVSQNDAWPAILISPKAGRLVTPSGDAVVTGFEETTAFPEVNEWLLHNRHLLSALAAQQIDVGEFYDRLWKPAS